MVKKQLYISAIKKSDSLQKQLKHFLLHNFSTFQL